MSPALQSVADGSWHQANYDLLAAELQRLRLRARRRMLWLRRRWPRDPLQKSDSAAMIAAHADALLEGEHRGAEVGFWRDDSEAAALTAAIRDSEAKIAARVQSGSLTPVEALARAFGLTGFERDALLLCVLPELDAALQELYGYLQDDVTRRFATPQLAIDLFCDDPGGWLCARDSFAHTAPLGRFRLLTLEAVSGPLTLRPLAVDERMADYVLGVNEMDARVRPLLFELPAPLLTPTQHGLVERIASSLEHDRSAGKQTLLNLIGPGRAGQQAIASALCGRLGLGVRALRVKRLPQNAAERENLLRLIERDAILLGFAVFLEIAAPEPGGDPAPTPSIAPGELDDFQGLLIVSSSQRWDTSRDARCVTVARPDAPQQRILWRQALNGAAGPRGAQIESLVQQFDLGPAEIAKAAAFASADTSADLWEICRDQFARDLDELAQRIEPCYAWDDIVLPADSAKQLREIANQVKLRSQVYEDWGFGAKLSRGRGISALFSGPSGTGKTMAAEVLAAELRLSLYRIDLAGAVSKYIGETEKNLRRIFDSAEESGAILFFDEADALFGKRVEIREAHDRYANIEINYLLQRMEDYRGLAVLATNKKSHMDEAFLRRLRFLVEFPFPDAVQRRRIWEKSFPPAAQTADLDFPALARLEIAGGNIRNIALNAAFLAAADRSRIRMDHVLLACRREYAKIDKLVIESEFGRYYTMVQR